MGTSVILTCPCEHVLPLCLCAVCIWVSGWLGFGLCVFYTCVCRMALVSVGRCLRAGSLRLNWSGPVRGSHEPLSTASVSLGTELPGVP